MTHVVMLLTNPFQPDPRVLKEARTLVAAGYRVKVLAWDREGAWPPFEEQDGIQIERLAGVRSTYGAGLRQLLRLPAFWHQAWRRLDALDPAVVHCHDFDTLPLGWLWAKRRNRPVVYDAHEYYADLQRPRLTGVTGALLAAVIERAEQWLSRRVDAVITVDEWIAARYRHPRLVIIGHYPPRDFADLVHRQTCFDDLAWSRVPMHSGSALEFASHQSKIGGTLGQTSKSGTPTLVYAGRLSSDRGLVKAALVLQELAAEGLHPRLRLIGRWTHAAEERAFRRACAGLEAQIEMIGWVPFSEVGAYIASADIGLALLQPIPRYVKAVPIKLFEYMACGTPVLISNFPAVRNTVRDAGCCIFVDPTDVESIADAVRLLLVNPHAAAWLGERGRHAFLQRFSWEILAPLLCELYSDLAPPADRLN